MMSSGCSGSLPRMRRKNPPSEAGCLVEPFVEAGELAEDPRASAPPRVPDLPGAVPRLALAVRLPPLPDERGEPFDARAAALAASAASLLKRHERTNSHPPSARNGRPRTKLPSEVDMNARNNALKATSARRPMNVEIASIAAIASPIARKSAGAS